MVLMGTPKVKNASNFRTELFDTLRDVSNGEAHVITHNAGEPVVLIAKSEYDALLDEREFLKDIAIGAEQLNSGQGVSHIEALKRFQKMKARWK
jgi:PHD/YefM family antitoxin component YafN of YafNO toxin-antitoxin module